MVRWLLHTGIRKFERQWDYDASYMHDIADASPRAAWLFSRATAIGTFRVGVPAAVCSAAGITAVRHEDCGPCTQIAVSMAERAGVSAAVLRAVLADDDAVMPEDVALAWRFARAVLARDPAERERAEIVRRWGRVGLVSLAFAITAARLYPTMKYALGHGQACMRVVVAGAPVMMDHGRTAHAPGPAVAAAVTARTS